MSENPSKKETRIKEKWFELWKKRCHILSLWQ